MSTLLSLPVDILIQVAVHLESTKDLESLALSCRSVNNVLQLYPKTIIPPVLKADLGAANYRKLLAILHMPHVVPVQENSHPGGQPNAVHSPLSNESIDPGAVLRPFLDHYFSDRSFDDPSDATSLRQIYKIHQMVCRHTDLYFEHTSRLYLARRYPDTHPIRAVPAISESERTRIRGGLLQYELYCRLFPYSRVSRRESQMNLFLRRLTTRELERLFCIQQYFASLTSGYLADWEEQFVTAVLSSQQDPCPSPEAIVEFRDYMYQHNGFEFLVLGYQKSRSAPNVALLGIDFHLKVIDAGRLPAPDSGRRKIDLLRGGKWLREVQAGGSSLHAPADTDSLFMIYLVGFGQQPVPDDGSPVLAYRSTDSALGIVFWDVGRLFQCLRSSSHRYLDGDVSGRAALRFELPHVNMGYEAPRRHRINELAHVKIPETALAKLVGESGWLSWLGDEIRRHLPASHILFGMPPGRHDTGYWYARRSAGQA